MEPLSPGPSGLPSFSIIVPTHRRPVALAACLDALASLDYPPSLFEVIVVDDGGLSSLPDPHRWASRLHLRLLSQPHAGPAAARNRGAAAAAGHWLAFVDDDCRPAPSWLRSFASAQPQAHEILAGRTINAIAASSFSTASQLLGDYVCDWLHRAQSPFRFCASNNLAVSAAHFASLGGFSTAFPRAAAEDREFCFRSLRAGGELRFLTDALVEHHHHLRFGSFCRQHFNYGGGARVFRRLLLRAGAAPLRLFPLPFYLGMFTHPARLLPASQAIPVTLWIFLSQVSNFLGFFWQALQARRH